MANEWRIGDHIQNRWEIHKILRGGMGIVYIVYDHEIPNAYAAKTFQDELFARNPATAERFTQEALTWINLDAHQNVTHAQFAQTIQGKPYLFLEYVSGGDLGGWIGTPRLTEDLPQVLRFAIQFCDGMTHALLKGIRAHRDIKPQNCLLTHDGTRKITDFGLVKVFDDASLVDTDMPNLESLSVGLTRTGMAAGTCTHMAPEQFDDAKQVGVGADIYSFGVMLHQMLTGRLPFVGRTYEEYRRLHKTQQPPTLSTQHSSLSSRHVWPKTQLADLQTLE
jgi:eukaryotic-like serine/threonine-protein kinase